MFQTYENHKPIVKAQTKTSFSKENHFISQRQNVKQGKEGEVKGKGIAKGEPLGEGETPCFVLGFVVSPSHIGSPFAGVPQTDRGHKGC